MQKKIYRKKEITALLDNLKSKIVKCYEKEEEAFQM